MANLKDNIGPASIGRLATAIARTDPDFPRREYERAAVQDLEPLELKARIDHVARSLATYLP
jgi:hypothetical protein